MQLWPNCKRDVHEPDLLESEIRTAISKIKSQKAPGIDGVEGKLIKGSGEPIIHIMHKICNKIWATDEFLMLWTKSLVVTIPNKGIQANVKKQKNTKQLASIATQVRSSL